MTNNTDINTAINTELTSEITHILYAGNTKSLIVATIVASILVYSQHQVVSTTALLTWAFILLTAYLSRYAFVLLYKHQDLKNINNSQWLKIYRLSTGACGIAWGSAGFLLFAKTDTLHQAYLFCCLAGVSSGAIVTYSVDKMTSFIFSICLILFGIPSFFIYGNAFSRSMGFLLVIYAIYITLVGLSNSKIVRESISLKLKSIRAKDAIDALSQRQKLHIENTPLGVIEWSKDFKVSSWNAAAEGIFGYSAQEAMNQSGSFLLPETARLLFKPDIESLAPDGNGHHAEVENICKDGSVIYCEWFNTPIKDSNGNVIGVASLVQNKTAVKKAQEEIQHLAYFDVLTNLPNRRLLHDRLNQALIASERNKTYGCAMYIDLDNFKALNDSKGHAMGDLLLQEVARRLQTLIREMDTVARIGGDEFVLVFSNIGANQQEASASSGKIAEKIIHEINQPYVLNGMIHHCSPSIGISLFAGKTMADQEVLKRADIAMYEAKQAGRNSFRVFNEAMQPALNLRADLKNDLSQAVQRDELSLFYQVQVDSDLKICGAEALLRWHHPHYDMVSPAEFIPLAEESGLIIPIGTWVLQQACLQLAKWKKSALTKSLQLSVNVSALQFSQADFVEKVAQAIKTSGCNAKLLTLELTESSVLHNIDDVVRKMKALKALDVSLSIDDFGVGYSSFSILKRLPLDELKIDQSFIKDSLEDHANSTIVKSIIDMGKNIGLSVIAEGVETDSQVNFLQNSQCKVFQGYLFGKPSNIQLFEDSLKTFASSQSFHTGTQPDGKLGTQPISI